MPLGTLTQANGAGTKCSQFTLNCTPHLQLHNQILTANIQAHNPKVMLIVLFLACPKNLGVFRAIKLDEFYCCQKSILLDSQSRKLSCSS